MAKSSEIVVFEPDENFSNENDGSVREYGKPILVPAKQSDVESLLEELAEVIEAEGCVLIP